MDNPVLTKKRKIKTPDGEMVDLSLSTTDKKALVYVENMHFVQEDEVMRLDLIANKYYGWADKLDAILWANNIYNPFAIDAHDWLIIPRVKDTNIYAVNPNTAKLPDDNTQSTSSKISAAANKLNSGSETAKAEREKQRAKRKPNQQVPGESHKKTDGAVILLG